MKLINIEGELLSTAVNIQKIIEYLNKNQDNPIVVTVAGDEAVEKTFKEIAVDAVNNSFDYTEKTILIENDFLQLARNIIPITQQSSVLSFIKQRFNGFEDLCKGIQLLGQAPLKTLEEIRKIPSTLLAYVLYKSISSKQQDVSYGEIDERNSIHVIPCFHNIIPNKM